MTRNWQESEHPRDPDGRFRGKPTGWVERIAQRLRPSQIDPIDDETEIRNMVGDVTDTSNRGQFIRQALNDKLQMPDRTKLYVAHDGGAPVGAISVVDYPDRDTPHMVIQSLGSTEPGVGTNLVRAAINWALHHRRDVLYVEPLETAAGFWESMGFEPDPLEVGTYYHGLTAEAMWAWHRRHP